MFVITPKTPKPITANRHFVLYLRVEQHTDLSANMKQRTKNAIVTKNKINTKTPAMVIVTPYLTQK